jgi:hypothetical protein
MRTKQENALAIRTKQVHHGASLEQRHQFSCPAKLSIAIFVFGMDSIRWLCK